MKEIPDYIFNGVRVAGRDEVYISSSIQQLNEDRVDNMVIHHYRNDRREAVSSAMHASAGMWPLFGDDGGVMCVAIDGEVFEFSRQGSNDEFVETQGEHVDTSPNGPSSLVHLRSVEKIGESTYCAGFARRVYQRGAGRFWTAVDDGTFVPRERRTEAIGFFGIGGLSEKEFYAVGLNGEIWSCLGGQWTEESSPTNVALNTISVLPSGFACIAGLLGVVICGRAGQWRTVQQDLTADAFWDSTVFQGRVYLANNAGVFVLNETLDELEQVYAGPKPGLSTKFLDARDGVMWSVGEKAIVRTDDGQNWHELPGPLD